MLPENQMDYFPPREYITKPTPVGTMTEDEIAEWRNAHKVLPPLFHNNYGSVFEAERQIGFYEGLGVDWDNEASPPRLGQIRQGLTPYDDGTNNSTPPLIRAMEAVDAIPYSKPFVFGASKWEDEQVTNNILVSRRRLALARTTSAIPSASGLESEDVSDRERVHSEFSSLRRVLYCCQSYGGLVFVWHGSWRGTPMDE